MSYSVLIVDDSHFFQARLKEIINEHPELNVVGIAANGQEAIDKEEELRPDIISMDYEMPFLDGVSAVRVIMSKRKVPIVMFSSMTYDGARITLDALEAGAVDFMPKNFAEVSKNSSAMKKKLHEKLLTFARSSRPRAPVVSEVKPSNRNQIESIANDLSKKTPSPSSSPSKPARSPRSLKGRVKLVVIGASTGGPVAVSDVICNLPENFPAPVIIVQHMPENFTAAFAERLNRQSRVSVKELESGDLLEKSNVYVVPGGKQVMVDRNGRAVKLVDGDDRINYKPSVDIAFASAASSLGSSVLGVVLTGMGNDGLEGAKLLKSKGSVIWTQDKDSCVIYGMPAAIAKENLSDLVLPIDQVAQRLISELM